MTAAENTLVIIKPDFMGMKNSILQLLLYNGFRITHRKIVNFTPEKAAEFYKELEKQDPCFAIKVMSLSKGSAEAVILNKVNAIRDLLLLMTSPICCNILNSGLEYKIHASVSPPIARNEIGYIFPNVIVEPKKKVYFGAYCGRKKLTGLFADAVFDACKCKAEDARIFHSKWLMENSYEYQANCENICDQ